MSELQGVDEVLNFLNKEISRLYMEKIFDRTYLNVDLISVLSEVRDGLVNRPEWSQVVESNLRADLERARSWAVRLEQELANAEEWVEAYRSYVRQLETQIAEGQSL